MLFDDFIDTYIVLCIFDILMFWAYVNKAWILFLLQNCKNYF